MLISQSLRNNHCMCSNFTEVGKVRAAGEVMPMGPKRIFVTVHTSITKITALKRNSEHWSAGITVKRRWYALSAFELAAFIDMNVPPFSMQWFYTFMGSARENCTVSSRNVACFLLLLHLSTPSRRQFGLQSLCTILFQTCCTKAKSGSSHQHIRVLVVFL